MVVPWMLLIVTSIILLVILSSIKCLKRYNGKNMNLFFKSFCLYSVYASLIANYQKVRKEKHLAVKVWYILVTVLAYE